MRPPLIPPEQHDWLLSDGCTVRGRFWPPREGRQPRAILYLHGIQSHGGWYEWSASVLAQASGAAVMLPDRRGSGLSAELAPRSRGDAPGAERLLLDVEEQAAWLRERYSVQRVSLAGVSWGGKLAYVAASEQRFECGGLLLVAPGLFPRVGVPWWTKLGIGAALAAQPERHFEIPLNEPELFTANPAGQRFIAGDPLRLRSATARFLYASAVLDRRLRKATAAGLAGGCTCVLAEADRIILNHSTERYLNSVKPPAHVHRLPGGHTQEFELEPGAFEVVLRDWAASAGAG